MQSRDVRRFEFGPWRRWSTVLCLLLLVIPAAAFAQTTGTVEGAVTDQSNSPLPGVTIELDGRAAAGLAFHGDHRGRAVPLPESDSRRLRGHGDAGGLRQGRRRRATVTLDATATANLQLNLSTTAEVTVTGEAPLIDATSTTTGSNYAGKVIDKLPLASRNYADDRASRSRACSRNGESQAGRLRNGSGA